MSSLGLRSLALLCGFAVVAVIGSVTLRANLHKSDSAPVAAPEPALAMAAVALGPEEFGLSAPLSRIDTELRRGETLSGLMDRLEVPPLDGAQALNSLIEPAYLDARRVQPGLKVSAYLAGDKLTAFAMEAEPGRRLLAKRREDGSFRGFALDSRLTPMPQVLSGTIETSLYNEARKLGAGDQQVVDFAQVFAYDVDFQREVHPGDKFELVFDVLRDERGNVIKRGDLLYAALDGKAITKSFYRFTTPDEDVTDYFQANGESATKFLMKTPINGARLSSSFGRRRHPISGYTRLHKGTDFAAPTGTPVYAAGHGTIERASRYGGYGNYVRIRHAKGYKTAYAHLSRYGRGIKSGRRVRQGDIIGYVGSTGASTGPHLHYEVYVNGKPVNAMRLKLPTGRKLAMAPEVFDVFRLRRDEIDAMRAAAGIDLAPAELVVAEAPPPAP